MAVGNHMLPTDLLETCAEGFFFCMGEWATTVTSGLWWAAMLLAFCFALYMATIQFGNTRAFGYATVTGLFGSLFLVNLGFIPWWIASAFILVGVLGIASMIISER